MAEWSIAAVLKTADCNRSGGSNPSLSAPKVKAPIIWGFFYKNMIQLTDGTELEISPTLVYSILEILKL